MNSMQDDPRTWLKTFKITIDSASPYAFNNHRQQIAVQLSVEPQAGQHITQRQFDTLAAVYQKDDGTFVRLPMGIPARSWSFSTEQDTRFDYYQGPDAASPERASSTVLSKKIYLHTGATGGSKITLFAQIEKNDSTAFQTDAGAFDSQIELQAKASPTFEHEDYNFISHPPIGDFQGGSRFNQEHELSLKGVKFSYASFSPDDTQGSIRWNSRESDREHYASLFAIALPGSQALYFNERIPLGPDFPPRRITQVKTQNPHSIVISIQGDDQIPYKSGYYQYDTFCSLNVFDRQGNLHRFRLEFDSNQSTPLLRRQCVVFTSTA
ncbi:hypothetical protein D3C76_325760 [compost metagenome]